MKRILAAFLAAAVALGLSSCARRAEVPAGQPRLVVAAPALRRDFVLSAEYAANIAPEHEVNITPKVGGRVAAVLVEVGAVVARGQALCSLDASDYAAEYRQAEAALGSARASLTRTSDSGLEQQKLQAKSAADQAHVAYDEAKSAYDRTKRLFDGGSVARQQLEDVEARFKAAGIQRDAADNDLALVEDKAGSQANEIVSAQVDQAGAQADLAKSRLDSTVIRSPIDGRVSYRNVETGEFVNSSTLAFVVIDERRVVAEAGLSERVVGDVRKGMAMDLVVPALEAAGPGQERMTGTVDSVSPAADPRSMLYAVRLLVPNPGGRLRGGMLARLKVPLETRRGVILVPERATFSENGADYVFAAALDRDAGPAGGSARDARAVRYGTASKRLVRLGESDGSSVEALEGLAEGDLVITAGQEFLGDGDRIAIAP
jgi:RND family efflux transporter MFP subunit